MQVFKKHYPELDLIRAIAITLVMLIHFSKRAFSLPQDGILTNFFHWGWNGVTLFFALSGFLIGGQIIESLSGGNSASRDFT